MNLSKKKLQYQMNYEKKTKKSNKIMVGGGGKTLENYSETFKNYHTAIFIESETFQRGRIGLTKSSLDESIKLFRFIFNEHPLYSTTILSSAGLELVENGHEIQETYGIDELIEYKTNQIIDTIIYDMEKKKEQIGVQNDDIKQKGGKFYFNAFRVYKSFNISNIKSEDINLFVCNCPTYCFITCKTTFNEIYSKLNQFLKNKEQLKKEIRKLLLCILLIYHPINNEKKEQQWFIYHYIYEIKKFLLIMLDKDSFEHKYYTISNKTANNLTTTKDVTAGLLGTGLTITAISMGVGLLAVVPTMGLSIVLPAILSILEATRSGLKEKYKSFMEGLKEPSYFLTIIAVIIQSYIFDSKIKKNKTGWKKGKFVGREYSDANIRAVVERKDNLHNVGKERISNNKEKKKTLIKFLPNKYNNKLEKFKEEPINRQLIDKIISEIKKG